MTDTSSLITTEYTGNYVYENSVLQFFNHAEGYVEPKGLGWEYVYQYKDHLGNVRLSYADADGNGLIAQTEIREENNYYPFGLKHKGYNNAQTGKDHKYGFGNKEEQDELGLGWIDITARNYDPALGRWMNLDPLAELMRRHSPYNYAFDNPIYFIDPDGQMPFGSNGGFDIVQDTPHGPRFVDINGNLPGNKIAGNASGGGTDPTTDPPTKINFKNSSLLAIGDGTEAVNELEGVTVVGEAKNATNCPDCLDPSTIGQNLLGLTYPGGDNPKTYAGDYSYSYVPTRLSEYPAIGHDRRYDNLGTLGVKGLLTDTRAIGADWRFVREELFIASSPYADPISRLQAGILGIGLGTAALPKTIFQLAQPNGQGLIGIIIWDNTSNIGVTNTPSTFKH